MTKIGFIISLLLLICCVRAFSQEENFGFFETQVLARNAQNIKLQTEITLPKGFYLYDDKSDIEGIAGIQFHFENIPRPTISVLDSDKSFEKINDVVFEKKNVLVLKNKTKWLISFNANEYALPYIKGSISYNISDGEGFYAETYPLNISLSDKQIVVNQTQEILRPNIDIENPVVSIETNTTSSLDEKETNLLRIFFLGFVGGLLALLTPCVFPIIPLTVSFFTKQSGGKIQGIKNASMYGFSIIFIYAILSLPFHFLDSVNPEILNNISTNSILNIIFFFVFIAFAFSFFGYYELTLPSKWMSKVDKKSSIGSMTGIFFMALTLALVSFSCTGPILGSLLVGSITSGGGAIQLTLGMVGFGLALALPFALLAFFPNWLKNLPKSGGWLGVVKVVFGFLEVAFAFKFLSNADLVEHWGILKREVFLGIWIMVGILFTLYILGIIRFPHQTKFKSFGWFRVVSLMVVAGFTTYLILGLTTKRFENLGFISGFPPPKFYSIFEKKTNCALDIPCEKDYFKGLERAKKENKPILLDFTGWACVNCRKMEENVWVNQDIYKLLSEEFILVSLYVDDRKKLPPDQQFEFVGANGHKTWIETIGDKWSKFETVNFKNNSQPLYAILDFEERLLLPTVAYMPNVQEYKNWLELGLNTYKDIQTNSEN